MNRRRSLIARLAPWLPPGLSLALCAWSPTFARRWRDGISLPAMRALHRLTARLPFPALEPLAIAAAACALAGLIAAFAQGLLHRNHRLLRRRLRGTLTGLLLLGFGCALLWAPVCFSGTHEAPPGPDVPRLEQLCSELIDALAAGAPAFPAPEVILRQAPAVAGLPGCART